MSKTKFKPREYDTLWWNQKAADHQSQAHQAIAYLESAIGRLKDIRDQPVMEAHGELGVTDAGTAMKSIMIALSLLWPHVEPSQVPSAEPGILNELKGAALYKLIQQAKAPKPLEAGYFLDEE